MDFLGYARDIGNGNILYTNLHNSCKILYVNNYEHGNSAKLYITSQKFKVDSL